MEGGKVQAWGRFQADRAAEMEIGIKFAFFLAEHLGRAETAPDLVYCQKEWKVWRILLPRSRRRNWFATA